MASIPEFMKTVESQGGVLAYVIYAMPDGSFTVVGGGEGSPSELLERGEQAVASLASTVAAEVASICGALSEGAKLDIDEVALAKDILEDAVDLVETTETADGSEMVVQESRLRPSDFEE